MSKEVVISINTNVMLVIVNNNVVNIVNFS